jgi:2-haloacid dehalogenase
MQYGMMRSLMGRYRDFWQLTEDGLVYACKSLGLELTAERVVHAITDLPPLLPSGRR